MSKVVVKFLVGGVLFGITFPISALVFDLMIYDLSFSMANIGILHQLNPIHWIIDTAPLFLGFFSFLIGKRESHIKGENKRLEKEVIKRTENLKYATDKLKEFAHSVSHDLRSPLSAIFALTSFIKDDSENNLSDKCQEHLDLITSRVNVMDSMITEVLEYSMKENSANKDKEEETDLDDLLNSLIQSFSSRPNVNIQIANKLPTVKGPRVQLTQIFRNLIDNAIKYNDKSMAEIVIDFSEKKECWKFEISDNGPGIPRKHHEAIFDFGFSLNKNDEIKSSGIGLDIVKKRVSDNGGEIWVDSDFDRGTKFCILWPK